MNKQFYKDAIEELREYESNWRFLLPGQKRELISRKHVQEKIKEYQEILKGLEK